MRECLGCRAKTDNPKYCSRSCAAKTNNKLFPKRIARTNYGACVRCGEGVARGATYCSLGCSIEYKKEKRVEDWLSERFIPAHIQSIDSSIRPWILNDQMGLCSICRGPQEHNGIKLTFILDHIDGNSEDNRRNNLRMICPNCDSQLPTYKSKNKGNGRHYRRQRYANGKSY